MQSGRIHVECVKYLLILYYWHRTHDESAYIYGECRYLVFAMPQLGAALVPIHWSWCPLASDYTQTTTQNIAPC
jgi:hypothetical protein